MPKVLILGGGLAGLAAAYFLDRRSKEEGLDLSFSVLEASRRWGGKISTEAAGGFLVEGGADSFITRKPWALELVRELGLREQVRETPSENGRVFVLRDGVPEELPAGMVFCIPTREEPFLACRLISDEGKRRILAEVDIPPGSGSADESVADFVRRRFGDEALERLGQPLMAGIHAADPKRLSLAAAFPEMARLEAEFGSLIRGMRTVHRGVGLAATRNSSRVSLAGGIGQLIETLVGRLDPSALHLRRPAVSLTRDREGFRARDGAGRTWTADAVILALPAHASAELLESVRPTLASPLREIRYVSTATLSLGFRTADVEHPLQGLGIVFPKVEGRKLQACTWSSSKFPRRAPEGHVLIRAFIGGAGAEHLVDGRDDALLRLALDELTPILGLRSAPGLVRLYRWPRGIPQLEIGHRQRLEAIEGASGDGLFLAGNAYRGIGLPDAVRSARTAVEALLAEIRSPRARPSAS